MDEYLQGAYDTLLWVHVNARKNGAENTILGVRDLVVMLADMKVQRFEKRIVTEAQKHFEATIGADLHCQIDITPDLYSELSERAKTAHLAVEDYVSSLFQAYPIIAS